MKKVNVISDYELNTYDVMNASKLVLFESTVSKIQETKLAE